MTGMERRGKSSEVGRRLAEEANARLLAAREAGWIEREMAEANHSLLDLSGDLAKAKAERDRRPSAEEVEKGKAEARQAYERFKAERAAQALDVEAQRLKAEQEAERERQRERQRTRSRDRDQDRSR